MNECLHIHSTRFFWLQSTYTLNFKKIQAVKKRPFSNERRNQVYFQVYFERELRFKESLHYLHTILQFKRRHNEKRIVSQFIVYTFKDQNTVRFPYFFLHPNISEFSARVLLVIQAIYIQYTSV